MSTVQKLSPTSEEDEFLDLQTDMLFDFRSEEISITVTPQTRFVPFQKRFTFVYVVHPDLRFEIEELCQYDSRSWAFEGLAHVYRLADLAVLLHRLCESPELGKAVHSHDLENLFGLLTTELDVLNSFPVQAELSLNKLGHKPGYWLQYYYWCMLVDHLRLTSVVVVKVDRQHGRVSPEGEPLRAKIVGLRQCEDGLMVCCSWGFGWDTVHIKNIAEMNSEGLYFNIAPNLHSPLLRGWMTQILPLATIWTLSEIFWGTARHC